MITIDSLGTAKLIAGNRYKLAQNTHTLTKTVSIPAGCTIDPNNARIEFRGAGSTPAISIFKNSGVRWLAGATFALTPTNYAAYIEHSENVFFGASDIRPLQGRAVGGGLIIRGCTNLLVSRIDAQRVGHYFVFMEGNNQSVILDRLNLTYGSKPDSDDPRKMGEAGIRILDSHDVTLNECTISCNLQGAKNSALRMQDGTDFRVLGGKYVGGFGAGPLADGDGGKRETDPIKRKEKIGKRLIGVDVINVEIIGSITLEAGLEHYRHVGGSIVSPSIFTGTTWRYPETESETKPGDPVRSQANGYLYQTRIIGGVKDNPVDIVDCEVNETRRTIDRVVK